jgi:hypothetical protein
MVSSDDRLERRPPKKQESCHHRGGDTARELHQAEATNELRHKAVGARLLPA